MSSPFLDTNILIYAVAEDPRSDIAQELLQGGGQISVQVLNEFANVARRKLGFDWPQIAETLTALRLLCGEVHPVTLSTHVMATDLAERYGFAFYDALIVAAALHARSDILYSEDMHHGLIVDDRLTILNPFRDEPQ